MYNLHRIQSSELCFHYSMSVSGQLWFSIFSALVPNVIRDPLGGPLSMFNLATALISLERMVATGNLVEMEVQQLRREFGTTAAVFCIQSVAVCFSTGCSNM